MWDIEVDIACVGAGPGTLASAVATTDLGATMLLATPTADRAGTRSNVAVQQRVDGFLGSWTRAGMDAETDKYLTALAGDLCAPGDATGDPSMTVRTVSAVPNGGGAEAFIGARQVAWNTTCLTSPYGMLVTSVSGWRTSRMRTEDGQSLEVQPIGYISGADLTAGFDATQWLRSQVSARGIEEHRFTDLQRIVFDDGRIVGVELVTPDGVLAVGVRHGLALSSGEPVTIAPPQKVDTADDLQLCIVGQAASRFLRIELLGTALQERPLCTASGRRLHEALRETRTPSSSVWRCGKPR